MKINYRKDFKKEFRKLNSKQQKQFHERLALFVAQPNHPQLRVHELAGKYAGNFSFSVSGDLRVHYIHQGNEIFLTRIGTHSQLYE